MMILEQEGERGRQKKELGPLAMKTVVRAYELFSAIAGKKTWGAILKEWERGREIGSREEGNRAYNWIGSTKEVRSSRG